MTKISRLCKFCEREGEHTPAVGEYFLKKSKDREYYGWIPVCKVCADGFERAGINIVYFKKRKETNVKVCGKCKYIKMNLVTNREDGRDLWKCSVCGYEVLKWGRPEQ